MGTAQNWTLSIQQTRLRIAILAEHLGIEERTSQRIVPNTYPWSHQPLRMPTGLSI